MNVLIVEKPHEYVDYHMIIADFLLLLMERIDKEAYLIDLFSSHGKSNSKSRSISKGSSLIEKEKAFLPFQIALFLLKQTNPLDKSGLLLKVLQILKF